MDTILSRIKKEILTKTLKESDVIEYFNDIMVFWCDVYNKIVQITKIQDFDFGYGYFVLHISVI